MVRPRSLSKQQVINTRATRGFGAAALVVPGVRQTVPGQGKQFNQHLQHVCPERWAAETAAHRHCTVQSSAECSWSMALIELTLFSELQHDAPLSQAEQELWLNGNTWHLSSLKRIITESCTFYHLTDTSCVTTGCAASLGKRQRDSIP